MTGSVESHTDVDHAVELEAIKPKHVRRGRQAKFSRLKDGRDSPTHPNCSAAIHAELAEAEADDGRPCDDSAELEAGPHMTTKQAVEPTSADKAAGDVSSSGRSCRAPHLFRLAKQCTLLWMVPIMLIVVLTTLLLDVDVVVVVDDPHSELPVDPSVAASIASHQASTNSTPASTPTWTQASNATSVPWEAPGEGASQATQALEPILDGPALLDVMLDGRPGPLTVAQAHDTQDAPPLPPLSSTEMTPPCSPSPSPSSPPPPPSAPPHPREPPSPPSPPPPRPSPPPPYETWPGPLSAAKCDAMMADQTHL